MVAPTSGERIAQIAENAEEFIYLVSSMGVTGVRNEITTDLSEIIAEIRKVSAVPVAIGFGISTHEQAKYYSALSDGVIVGSAIVSLVGQYGRGAKQALYDYMNVMKQSVLSLL